MLVPARIAPVVVAVIDLNVAHVAFRHAPRHETLPPEIFRLLFVDAVEIQRRGRFVGNVHQTGRVHLHAIREFKRIDRRFNLAFVRRRLKLRAIESLQQLKLPLLFGRRQFRVRNIFDARLVSGLFSAANRGALINGGQKCVAIVLRPAHSRRRTNRDEARHVLIFRTEPIGNPTADRRPHEIHRTGVKKECRRPVRHAFRVHRVNETQIIDVLRHVWKKFRNIMSAFAILLEAPRRFHHPLLDHLPKILKSITRDIDFLVVILLKLRFVIERIDVARPALHENKNDPFDARRKMRCFRREWIDDLRRSAKRIATKPRQREITKSACRAPKHLPSSQRIKFGIRVHPCLSVAS